MSLPPSRELNVVLDESRDVADRLDQPLTSAHLLLCLFTLKNRASMFLSDQQVTADRLLDQLRSRPDEAPGTWDRILRRAHDVATVARSETISSLHLLVALCSFVDSAAYQLMARLDLDMGTIRNTALSYLTAAAAEEVDEPADEPVTSLPAAVSAPPQTHAVGAPAMPGPVAKTRVDAPHDDEYDDDAEPLARGIREPDDVRRSRRRRAADTRRRLADRLHRATGGSGAANPTPSGRTPRVEPSNLPLPPTVVRARGREQDDATPAKDRTAIPSARRERPRRVLRHQLVLREHQFPLLAKLGRNLTLLAFDGQIDDVIGRDDEIDQLVDILNKRRANNPVLVGEPGVGKTAVVEGLAHRIVGTGDADPPSGLDGRILVELEASRVVSGTGLRGSFAERMQGLKAEVARAGGRVVLFLDELHHWIGMGASGDGAADGAGELKTALARGEFPCVGATTFDEYRKFIETDPAFERRFQQVRVEEPSVDDATRILEGVRERYEAHHGVRFEPAAIGAAVRLSHRYLPDRRLPDKAISILDLAGSRARRIGANAVATPLVTTLVAEQAGLSPERLLMADRERFLDMEARLMQRIVGHRDAIERVAQVLRRNYAGFVSGRPIGSFLFLGPTGVGKTEFARALTALLFDDDDAMVRLDMSEFMESHSVARLIGSPPGYVGHDAGGQLTEAIRRRPYQLVLLDEVEKAHPDVLNVLIQLLDEGRLTDSRGRTVDFSNTVVVMTSNLGADESFSGGERRVGFGAQARAELDRTDAVRAAARRHFRPELWNRIDEALVFEPLDRDAVARIARLQLTRSSERLLEERGIAYHCAPEVIDLLIERGGYDPELGARPMRRTIERLVEAPIADLILRGDVEAPAELELTVDADAIVIRPMGDAGPSRP